MKLLVISDTHGRYGNSQEVIEKLRDRICAVIHLGDMVSDARFLQAQYDMIPFHYVAGNCDYYISTEKGLPDRDVVEYNGIKIFITHGHLHSVKNNYTKLAEAARAQNAAVAFCGHTHTAFCKKINGVLVVNPGSIEFPRGGDLQPSYAVLDVSDENNPEAGIVKLTKRSF